MVSIPKDSLHVGSSVGSGVGSEEDVRVGCADGSSVGLGVGSVDDSAWQTLARPARYLSGFRNRSEREPWFKFDTHLLPEQQERCPPMSQPP